MDHRDLRRLARVPPVGALLLAAAPAFVAGCGDTAEVGPGPEATDVIELGAGPVVQTEGGRVRGVAVPGGYAFRGVPYATPPTGPLRWRAPRPPAPWDGVRDATAFAPSCPQPSSTATKGPLSEDCLYLNVYTPHLGPRDRRASPVLVWIHGGGFTTGAGRDYDPTKLTAEGLVVVTINYRLGALGFLAHPALASGRGASSGNYGLMDQQASLRWVADNITRFGGDPRNVTIAGESAGGLSVLAHLVARSSRGLFERAIVQSGSFAPTQQPLAAAEADGEAFARTVHCAGQTAACLRDVAVLDLVGSFPPNAIPGVVDGAILTESIGTALAAGRFTRVPILNGANQDEELIFVLGLGLAVSGGTYVKVPAPVTPDSYQDAIAVVQGVTAARAAKIAAEYPLTGYPMAALALSALVGDANFACPALQQDRWTSRRGAPTFAYEFNDDAAPPRLVPIPGATHTSELGYLFDLPDGSLAVPFTPDQEQLAASMRAAWAQFAATGDPSSAARRWPSFTEARVMSLVPPQPHIETTFGARHHCAFWSTL